MLLHASMFLDHDIMKVLLIALAPKSCPSSGNPMTLDYYTKVTPLIKSQMIKVCITRKCEVPIWKCNFMKFEISLHIDRVLLLWTVCIRFSLWFSLRGQGGVTICGKQSFAYFVCCCSCDHLYAGLNDGQLGQFEGFYLFIIQQFSFLQFLHTFLLGGGHKCRQKLRQSHCELISGTARLIFHVFVVLIEQQALIASWQTFKLKVLSKFWGSTKNDKKQK